MKAQAVFDIAGSLEASRGQRLDAILGGRAAQRCDAGVPAGTELDIRRQAGIDQPLRLSDRPFIEFGDTNRQGVDIGIEVGIG